MGRSWDKCKRIKVYPKDKETFNKAKKLIKHILNIPLDQKLSDQDAFSILMDQDTYIEINDRTKNKRKIKIKKGFPVI